MWVFGSPGAGTYVSSGLGAAEGAGVALAPALVSGAVGVASASLPESLQPLSTVRRTSAAALNVVRMRATVTA
ncbi:hypothetical protein ASD11_05895 [Aeromicrobium sp. Root495]|nr:hypothetical protein ASD11_05895 [Aeromicrobium sp. Root495]